MPPVSENELVDAYRLLLGREPESTVRVNAVDKWSSWKEMRADFLASPEGRMVVADALFDSLGSDRTEGLRRSAWVKTATIFGRSIYVCLKDKYVSRGILLHGSFSESVSLTIESRLTPDTVFLDLGANIGWFTLFVADYIARNHGAGVVYSVEANPTVLPYLYASVVEANLAPYVQIKPYAITATQTLLQMDSRTTGNLGGYGVNNFDKLMSERNIVPGVRIDDVFCDLQRLDLIKMDIEGFEFSALEGAQATLKRLKPTIIVELNVERLFEVSRKTVPQLLELMNDLGYLPYDFQDHPVGEEVQLSSPQLDEILTKNKGLYDIMFMPGRPAD
jgi:FkbM family methyltransferase